MLLIKDLLQAARKRLVTIVYGAKLVEAVKLLSSGVDLVIVYDRESIVQSVLTETDFVRQITPAKA
jgi:predicted transcriptional regulator